jgi:hypothetical protein
MGQRVKEQWELYTDEELAGGAERWGLTLQQERQRLRFLQSDYRQWPKSLLAYVKSKHSSGLELIGFTVIQHSIVAWLKEGNSADVLPVPVVPVEVAVAVAA